jgi:hypothetical protein
MKPRTYILMGLTLVAGGITYGVATRQKKKKQIKAIFDALEKETGATGTFEDLEKSAPFDPNYWKSVQDSGKATKYLKAEYAKKYAKQIYDALDWIDDEDAVFAVYQRIRNHVQASQIAYYFGRDYKTPLYDYLDDDLNSSEMDKINNYLKVKPKY